MAAPVLELRDIQKRFGTVIALAGVTVSVNAGEVHCLLGDNGASGEGGPRGTFREHLVGHGIQDDTADMAARLADGSVSAVELTQAHLDRIAATDEAVAAKVEAFRTAQVEADAKAFEALSTELSKTPEGRRSIQDKINPALQVLSEDRDADVRYYATHALQTTANV